jgi:serine protease Do
MYELPQYNFKEVKNKIIKIIKDQVFWGVILLIVVGCLIGGAVGFLALKYFPSKTNDFLEYFKAPEKEVVKPEPAKYVSEISYEQAIIDTAKNVSPSVVSIVISKDVPIYEQQITIPFDDGSGLFNFQIPGYVQKGSKFQEVGAGSGFVVSENGLILTNKHVVSDKKAEYAVYTNDGKKYPAKVLALDPVQDLAVIKIEPSSPLKVATLGDSNGIQIGQTAIAIGNALGQFNNTVSVGIVSGLGRTVSASDQAGTFLETLEEIIQTDAAINSGNSGGPLVNLKGEVIGVNTAVAEGAQSIGFALPINLAKKAIDQVSKNSKITYPFLGVRYVLINQDVKNEYKLSVDYGAYILRDKDEPAVVKGSAADKAGLKEKDIVLEINGEKIITGNSISKIVRKYNAKDVIYLKILRGNKEKNISVILGEKTS